MEILLYVPVIYLLSKWSYQALLVCVLCCISMLGVLGGDGHACLCEIDGLSGPVIILSQVSVSAGVSFIISTPVCSQVQHPCTRSHPPG